MEVWSAWCDGGRAVLPGCSCGVCTTAAGSREPCDTTGDVSGPGTPTHIAHSTHVVTVGYVTVLVLWFQKLEAWETVSEMVSELTEMVGI